MKGPFIALLSLFIAILLFSSEKQHVITLEKIKIPVRNVGFQLLQVTNATGKPTAIGFVEKSINYENVPAHFARDIAEELKSFLDENLVVETGSNELILRVNSLKISESYNGVNETAMANLDVTFIYKKGERYYEKLTVSKAAARFSSIGVTKHQPKVIGQAIADCFDAFYERSKEGKLTSIEIPAESLTIKPNEDKELLKEMLAADRSKQGIYKTYLDFKENTPDFGNDFELDYKIKSSGDESVSIKHAKANYTATGDKVEDVWGFTDGKVVFTTVGNKYLPLLDDEDGYYLELKVADQSGMMMAGMAGGLIGSSIAYAAAPIRKVRLNHKTGIFKYSDQMEIAGYKDRPAFSIAFFSSAYNNADSRIELYVNEELKCTLEKETWYRHELNGPAEMLNVTIKSSNGLSLSKEIKISTNNEDVFLCVDKKKKEPQIRKVLKEHLPGINTQMTPENRIYDKGGLSVNESN